MKIVKGIEYIKQQAVPGNAMFSYDRRTGIIEFVEQMNFIGNEANGGTLKYYSVPKDDFKLYLQAVSPDMAKKKFASFLKYYKNKSKNEKEKIKTGHPQLQE